jgi:hypothetical protein
MCDGACVTLQVLVTRCCSQDLPRKFDDEGLVHYGLHRAGLPPLSSSFSASVQCCVRVLKPELPNNTLPLSPMSECLTVLHFVEEMKTPI